MTYGVFVYSSFWLVTMPVANYHDASFFCYKKSRIIYFY